MKKNLYILAIAALFCVGCSSSDDGGGSSSSAIPEAALLALPANNSECTTGTVVSATESKITFQWNPSENATTYFVYVKNLVTQSTLQYSAGGATSLEVTLLKGVPYSWYVSSRNAEGDATPSATWKFYNAGDGVVNYAPFPAEVVTPLMSSTIYGTAVNLEWNGSDIDNDIDTYKVYFGTNATPTTLLGTITQETMANVPVVANATYYWKIVTMDDAGNSSHSPVFQFKVL